MSLFKLAAPKWRAFSCGTPTPYVVRELRNRRFQVLTLAPCLVGRRILSSCSAPVASLRDCRKIVAMQHGVPRAGISFRRER